MYAISTNISHVGQNIKNDKMIVESQVKTMNRQISIRAWAFLFELFGS